MFHIQRSSDPKLRKREVTNHLHDTSFSPSHGLREDLCCGGSRRINPGLDSNTFVSGMTTHPRTIQKTSIIHKSKSGYEYLKSFPVPRLLYIQWPLYRHVISSCAILL